MFCIRSGGMPGILPLECGAADTCTDPSGISLSVGITWAEISVKESGPMSNIWKRGSVPTGGFLVAVACATPAENVGPVLVPVD